MQGIGDGADEAVVAHIWLRGRKRGTLAQFVIGTIDRVLFAGPKERVDVRTYQRPQRSAQYGCPMHVDTSFDFRNDTPEGKDPDGYSPNLRSYHKFLWSRDLPNGLRFTLNDDTPNEYLHHKSELGEFFLASDACLPTYHRYPAAASIISRVPEVDRRHFDVITYTIGGMMIFPGDRRDGKMTINGAKGFHPRIRDRMDLTLECISRHYRQEASPLADTLARYRDFFALFEDFRGYVDFFLLDDLITDDFEVTHFIPFNDFDTQPIPGDLDTYLLFCERSIDFVKARNRRIERYAAAANHTAE